ncbi:MAG: MCE family protein [Bacteroidetes bacterium]|nr:MCE family protein [Bacteroidota bacterium]
MDNKVKKDITLGIFITIGLLLFVGLIYYIGSQQQLFGDKVKVVAMFKNVSGLQKGNNVRFSGIKIGTVKSVEIATDSTARVVLTIDEDVSRFIKTDSYASIESEGLMGNKIISVSSGSEEGEPIEDGDLIRSKEAVNIDDVITSFKATSDNARDLTGNLNLISEQIKNAEGLLAKIVSDSVLSEKVSNVVVSLEKTGINAAQITRQVEIAARQVNSGNGLLSKTLHDEGLARDLDVTIDSVKNAGKNLAEASKELKIFMEKLNNNRGMIDKLLNDSVSAKKLEETMHNVQRGTEDLDKVMETVNESWLLNLFSGGKDDD